MSYTTYGKDWPKTVKGPAGPYSMFMQTSAAFPICPGRIV